MKKKTKRMLAALIMVLVMALFCITAFANATVAPKENGQNKILWCWATAAKIVAEHNGGEHLSHSAEVLTNTDGIHYYGGVSYCGKDSNGNITANGAQRSIVIYVKGDDKNNKGGDLDKTNALSYAADDYVDVGTFGLYGTSLSDSDISSIKADLNNGKYVMGNMVVANQGHTVAILSYRSSDDKYRILDPWDMTDYYYASSAIFSTAGFPIFGGHGRIEWIQYCR